MPIHTALREFLTTVRMYITKKKIAVECVEEEKYLLTLGRRINWYSHYAGAKGFQLLKLEFPYN